MMILNTLEYDGRIERIDNDDGDRFRQALLAIPETSAFTSIPCGVCPVSNSLSNRTIGMMCIDVQLAYTCNILTVLHCYRFSQSVHLMDQSPLPPVSTTSSGLTSDWPDGKLPCISITGAVVVTGATCGQRVTFIMIHEVCLLVESSTHL